MSRSHPPGRSATRPANRRAILLEAIACRAVERGFEAASNRDIAANVRIHPRSIYHHLPSEADLMLAASEQGMWRVIEAAATTAIEAARLSAAARSHMRSHVQELAPVDRSSVLSCKGAGCLGEYG